MPATDRADGACPRLQCSDCQIYRRLPDGEDGGICREERRRPPEPVYPYLAVCEHFRRRSHCDVWRTVRGGGAVWILVCAMLVGIVAVLAVRVYVGK